MNTFRFVGCSLMLIVSTSATSKQYLSDSQWQAMLRQVPKLISGTPYENEDEIKYCWTLATQGDERALSALYLTGKAAQTINQMSDERTEILISSKTPGDAYLNMKDRYKRQDVNKLQRALKMLPRSLELCRKMYEERRN